MKKIISIIVCVVLLSSCYPETKYVAPTENKTSVTQEVYQKQTEVRSIENENQCDIKGNISIESGEKIYHVPGQKYYAKTKISPEYGERWFCTEEEARQAGWRKARE